MFGRIEEIEMSYSLFRKIFIGYCIFSLAVDIYYLGKLSNETKKELTIREYGTAFIINFFMLLFAVFT